MPSVRINLSSDQVPKNISDILSSGEYKIPNYQREYKWSVDQWDEFYDSIQQGEVNFIGIMFFHNAKNESYEVIDGQQRLTTIFLLLKSFEIVLQEKNEIWKKRKRYLVEISKKINNLLYLDDKQGKRSCRLQLQDFSGANKYFQDLLLRNKFFRDPELIEDLIEGYKCLIDLDNEELLDTTNSKQRKTLQNDIRQYKEILKELRKELSDSKQLWNPSVLVFKNMVGACAYFKKHLEKLTCTDFETTFKNLIEDQLVIRIIAKDRDSVYEYFKTLNATGIRLDNADIIKNTLFSNKPSDKVINKYNDLLLRLNERKLDMNDLLFYHLNSRSDIGTIAKSLKIENQSIPGKYMLNGYEFLLNIITVDQLVEDLAKCFEEFQLIMKPELFNSFGNKHFFYYNAIRQFAPKKAISLLLLSKKINKQSDHLLLCKIITYVVVKHVMLDAEMKELEALFYKVRTILNDAQGIEGALAKLAESKTYQSSELTVERFANHKWKNDKSIAINYLLYMPEFQNAKNNLGSLKEYSCEHVMPKNPLDDSKKEWYSKKVLNLLFRPNSKIKPNNNEIKNSYWQSVNQIGNHIIIKKKANSGIGNKEFKLKKAEYKHNSLPHIQSIVKKSSWSQNDISIRNVELFAKFEQLKTYQV